MGEEEGEEKDVAAEEEEGEGVVVVEEEEAMDAAEVVGEKDAAAVKVGMVVEKVVVVVEKDVAAVVVGEGTCSSKYPNPYSHHPCVYHRLCVREKRNSQLKESTKPPVDIRLHRLGEWYSLV